MALSASAFLTRLTRRGFLALCIPLLVLAQQGIWLHALSHLASHSLSTPASGSDEHGDRQRPCHLCLAFSTLDSGASAPVALVPVAAEAVDRPNPAPAPAVAHGSAAHYDSRAPPSLA